MIEGREDNRKQTLLKCNKKHDYSSRSRRVQCFVVVFDTISMVRRLDISLWKTNE